MLILFVLILWLLFFIYYPGKGDVPFVVISQFSGKLIPSGLNWISS